VSAVPADLVKDPIFQLNVVLWSVRPAAPSAPVRPVLREAGYVLVSLSPGLQPPVSLRASLIAVAGSADAPHPRPRA